MPLAKMAVPEPYTHTTIAAMESTLLSASTSERKLMLMITNTHAMTAPIKAGKKL